jgi:hypothetical protein
MSNSKMATCIRFAVFFLVLAYFALNSATAQSVSVKVFKVSGCIHVNGAKDCMTTDQDLSYDDMLLFSSPLDFVLVINTDDEVLLAKAPDTTGFANGKELLFSVKKSIQEPAKGEKRGEVSSKMVNNLGQYFGDARFTVIDEELQFTLNPRFATLSKDKYIVFNYVLDTMRVSKRLGFQDQVVRIQKDKLLEMGGKNYHVDFVRNVDVYVYTPANKDSKHICQFDLFFVSKENLFKSFSEVLLSLKKRTKRNQKEISNSLKSYFEFTHGYTDEQVLQKVVNEFIDKHVTE